MSLDACADITRRGDPLRFRFAMAAPVAARKILFPLYAFNVEVARAPWVTQEPMIAEMRLQWWRDALGEIAEGGKVRTHEVTTPLAAILTPADARMLDALVAARRWDIYRDPFEDAAHFEDYIGATSGILMAVAARALSPDDDTNAQARDAGFALGLANWLMAIPALEARGRVPLVDGRGTAVAYLARSAVGRLAACRRRGASRAAAPAFFSASVAGPVLNRAARDPARVAQGSLALSPAHQAALALWCATTRRW